MRTHRSVLPVLAILVIDLSGCAAQGGGGTPGAASSTGASPVNTAGRGAAMWAFSKGFTPTPAATVLKVEVSWRGCAGGAPVKDPQPVVSYSTSQVTLTVWGVPPDGNAFNCQGNPTTTLTVPLTEQLGDRTVVQGATTFR